MGQTKEGAAKTAAKYYNLSLEEYLYKIQTYSYCNKCKRWKLREEFCADASRSNGLHKNCNSCRRVKERKCTKGRISTFKGKHHTVESKLRMSIAHKGIPVRHSEQTKIKIGLAVSGPRLHTRGPSNHNWKGGVSSESERVRRSPEYQEWRKSVFRRDNHACQLCGDNKGGNLIAHHIYHFAKYPELRLNVDNGLTVCQRCHSMIHDTPFSTRKVRKLKQKEKGGVCHG